MGSLVFRCCVFGEDDRFDIATYREISNHTHPARGEQRDQIVEDGVSRRFVADLPVTIFIDIELQGLQFYHVPVWYVVNGNGGKIGKARPGTEAGELRYLQVHDVISLCVCIGPYFQLAGLYLI